MTQRLATKTTSTNTDRDSDKQTYKATDTGTERHTHVTHSVTDVSTNFKKDNKNQFSYKACKVNTRI